jgi:hypothetical protein
MNESKSNIFAIWGWRIAIVLASIILLLGNALPWPCIGSASDCTALITRHLGDSWYGLLIVIGILLMPVEISLLEAPLNYIVWSLFWFLLFLLFIASIYPIYMGTEIWAYIPMLDTNEYLPGPSRLVTPLSFVAFWLAVRPRNLQELWKFGSIVALITLVVFTGAIYISLQLETRQFLLSSYFDPARYVFGTGPFLILIGAVTVLAAEFFETIPKGHKTRTVDTMTSISS